MISVEAKSYNDVRKTITVGNCAFAIVWLIFAYLLVLAPAHKRAFESLFDWVKLNPFVGPLLTLAAVGWVWGYLTTFMFSIHDRVYEPHLVNWRASYDADFILRSLCLPYSSRVSSRMFEIAFTDKKIRDSLMQRLFYKFIGDSKAPHEELRERFYTKIRDYWLLVIAEIYCIAFLLGATLYCIFAAHSASVCIGLLVAVLASLLLRFWSNRCLPNIRPVTAEQINVIHLEHRDEFEKALNAVVVDFQLRP
jgi:hypothetical protein